MSVKQSYREDIFVARESSDRSRPLDDDEKESASRPSGSKVSRSRQTKHADDRFRVVEALNIVDSMPGKGSDSSRVKDMR